MNGSRRNARGESTLRSILAETAALVSQFGYDATTISKISKSTGKPASSLYWFFETKDELIAASLESTYERTVERIQKWVKFEEGQNLQEQLERIMVDQLKGAKTERPVRLGLMVALEGSAYESVVQEPFQNRRRAVRSSLQKWWQNVAELHELDDPNAVGIEMMQLTVAFLDGHYISDTELTTVNLEQKSEFVAACLVGAFAEPSRGKRSVVPQQKIVDQSSNETKFGTHEFLLSATRQLVSERGYEGATLTRICERSGMQRSSVYWRYSDKDRLVEAAVAGPFLNIMAMPLPEDFVGGQETISHIATALIDGVRAGMQNRETVRAGLLMKLQHRTPPAAASISIQEALAEQENTLAQWLTVSGGLPSAQATSAAWGLTVLTEGLILAIAFGQNYDTDVLLQRASAMLSTALHPAGMSLEQ